MLPPGRRAQTVPEILLEPAAARLRPKPPARTTSGGVTSATLISPSGRDGQAPPLLDAIATEPLAVDDKLNLPHTVEVEEALPSGMDCLAPLLDDITLERLHVDPPFATSLPVDLCSMR
jgi:hypothetical protein